LEFLLGFKVPRCYRVGDALRVYLFDVEASAPVIQYVGDVTVKSILSMKIREVSEELTTAMGITKARYLQFAEYMKSPEEVDMIVRFGSFKAADLESATSIVPPSAPRTQILTYAAALELKRRRADAVLVDIRSPGEIEGRPVLAETLALPYVLADMRFAQFSWKTTNGDLLKDSFDWNLLSSRRRSPVIIIGSGDRDPRPLYAIVQLFSLDFREIFWVYEGVPAAGR
jgi:hypothetical protein